MIFTAYPLVMSLFRRTTTSSCNIVRANIECRFLDKKIETIIRHAKHNEIVKWSNILPIRRTSSPFHRPATCICPCWCPIHLWEIERETWDDFIFITVIFAPWKRKTKDIYIYIKQHKLTFEPVDLLLELLDGLLGKLGAGFGLLQFDRQGLQLALEFLDSLIGLKIFIEISIYQYFK